MATAYQSNVCTCGCPDGSGLHLVGCHTYDSPEMNDLRYRFYVVDRDLRLALRSLSDGHVAPNSLPQFASDLRHVVGRLCIAAAKIAIEDEKNPDGAHNAEPWRV